MSWLNSLSFGEGGDVQENALAALVAAKDIAPGGFIALATDNQFHYAGDPWNPTLTTLTEAQVVSQLSTARCNVYIDPTYPQWVAVYQGLAVNGSIESDLGSYTFPLLQAAVLSP